ncbi:uncharacterized protein E0L32_010035 [Thyridium curvatum]|uniref:Uncharacterized protein n=1 Tax=Thyridium curvatum TaxID=1093900 RepID=A0A507AUL2_9PEZI|nr:uncharacterized protein E0L32_010035 [Thyridium curvatum]TPX08548.1 hypothetical protein E0L32_010035 [Thyridium curvatum]
MTEKVQAQVADLYDVVIVGAGISGINTAHHIRTQLPNLNYAIFEARDKIGGTWDLFRYPGIRSDTDLQTFGFEWKLWVEKRAIADGASIARYLHEAAEEDCILPHIKFGHRVDSANWSSEDQAWNMVVRTSQNSQTTVRARFLVLGSGYYDYKEPLKPQIPGLYENFKGQIVHPQFWPEDLEYTGKKVVIIGSGATAITLLPNVAKKAGHVTMLQRSPTYILSTDNTVGNSWTYRVLPKSWALRLSRWSFMWMTAMIFYLCRAFPGKARSKLEGMVAEQLPKSIPLDPHFRPRYQPWDQRLCFTPNGDFFESMREGKAAVETGHVETVTEHAIILQSGQKLEADIVVTATGLKLALGGHIKVSVDGEQIDLANRYAWRTAMLQDVPNLAFILGYVNASWTLGAEATAHIVCRVLQHMEKKGLSSATPKLRNPSSIRPVPIWNLESTYVKEAASDLPKCGDSGPWKGRTNYFWDLCRAKYGSITTGLEFTYAQE